MLTHLKIRDFAIVSRLELDFHSGFSVITGETGAGKSILMDALGLCLGNRAEAGVVRASAERADISAGFDLQNIPSAKAWLAERELESDDECWLRRTVNQDGRSRAYINGSPVTLADIRTLGDMLIDIHGQHEHQSLLRKDNHRILLDASAGLSPRTQALSRQFLAWQKAAKELRLAQQEGDARLERLDLLTHQLQEFDALALKAGDYEKLEQQHDALANIDSLLQNGSTALNQLSEADGDTALSLIQHALKMMETERLRHPTLQDVSDLLESAAINVREAVNGLQHYLDSIEADPRHLENLESQLSTIHQLARKHRQPPEDLHHLHQVLQDELASLQQSQDIEALQKNVKRLEADYLKEADSLRKARQKSALHFSQEIQERLAQLGMPNARFEICLTPLEKPAAHGLDDIEFLISANPGQPLKGLSKVASGGELSRVSLAIQVVNAKHSPIPAMVFDEVDVGIGGGIAEVVGRMLRELGQYAQVFSITHQPQVAALGHQHLRVEKSVENGNTSSTVRELSHDERIDEIARMSGGITITAETRKHAEAMLAAT